MKKIYFMILVSIFFGCSDPENPDNSPPPIPSNGIQIGNQIWMKENLRVKSFKNGDPILESKSAEEWFNAYKDKKPMWSYYLWDSKNGSEYGIIYNYYALTDSRGIAPEGWRIPTSTDFFELVEFNGGSNVATLKLMSENLWDNGVKGNNQSGFNAKPGGEIWSVAFTGINEISNYWTNSKSQSGGNILFSIYAFKVSPEIRFTDISNQIILNASAGSYIRCIKD